jgi:hypothetical protein
VGQKGQVSIYNRNHYVGKVNSGKEVWVMFADEPCRWVVANDDGAILKGLPAPELAVGRIIALDVTHRRNASGEVSAMPPGQPRQPRRAHGKTSRRD